MKLLKRAVLALLFAGCSFVNRPHFFSAADAGNPNAKPIYPVDVQPVQGVAKLSVALPVTPPLPTDAGTVVTYATNPLYSIPASLSTGDVNQYLLGDCNLHAVLESICLQNPWFYSQIATRNAAGQNVVTFRRILASPDMVVIGDKFSAGLSATPNPVTGAIIDPVIEEAEAYYHSKANTFASLNDVWAGNIAADLGVTYQTVAPGSVGQAKIKATLAAGNIATASTNSVVPSPLVPSHCYAIVSIDAAGNVTLRNPWGANGATGVGGVNPPGSLVTVPWAVFAANCPLGILGLSYPISQPVPPPLPPIPAGPKPMFFLTQAVTSAGQMLAQPIPAGTASDLYVVASKGALVTVSVNGVAPQVVSGISFPIAPTITTTYTILAQTTGGTTATTITVSVK